MVRTALVSLFFGTALLAEKPANEIAKVSEAFGHLIGKNMEAIGVDFDMALVIKGLQDAANGKESPLSETECIEALASAQEQAFQKKATENLAAAEAFLKKNASDKKVVSLEEGKVQYKVEKRGKGKEVEATSSPMIKYIGKYLDGSVFGKSEEEQMISLTETIPGFTKGLVGMKEGEKRTLYIHPDFGYGTSGYLPPNSLLTFEIEVVKANTEKEDFTDSLILEGTEGHAGSADFDSPKVR